MKVAKIPKDMKVELYFEVGCALFTFNNSTCIPIHSNELEAMMEILNGTKDHYEVFIPDMYSISIVSDNQGGLVLTRFDYGDPTSSVVIFLKSEHSKEFQTAYNEFLDTLKQNDWGSPYSTEEWVLLNSKVLGDWEYQERYKEFLDRSTIQTTFSKFENFFLPKSNSGNLSEAEFSMPVVANKEHNTIIATVVANIIKIKMGIPDYFKFLVHKSYNELMMVTIPELYVQVATELYPSDTIYAPGMDIQDYLEELYPDNLNGTIK